MSAEHKAEHETHHHVLASVQENPREELLAEAEDRRECGGGGMEDGPRARNEDDAVPGDGSGSSSSSELVAIDSDAEEDLVDDDGEGIELEIESMLRGNQGEFS